ncbi:hypothetical protein ACH9D2_08480 [Kocuria sp. M4R2S49]|uniref:hypothetical protein n=1 Tax=Kocuria rhizosphaericola TaxID=3376284 RepID=UPI003792A439
MSQYRTPTAYVLGVLVLLGVIVLTTPNGGTHARWSTTAQAEVPAMTAGRIGFDVVGAGSSATLSNTSGFGVGYRPLHVSLTGTAGEPVTTPAGMRFTYRTGTDCGEADAPEAWTAVAPGGSGPVAVLGETRAPLERDRPAGLCLTVSTEDVAEEALLPLAGLRLQAVTRLEAASLGDGTWSTSRSWTVPFTVEPPPADPPAEEQTPADPPATTAPARPGATDPGRCGADTSGALLRWTWPDGAPAVTAWQIRVRPVGSTGAPTLVLTVRDSSAREAWLTAADLPSTMHSPGQDHEVLVRAVLATGDSTHVDSPYAWKIKSPGESRRIICGGLPS